DWSSDVCSSDLTVTSQRIHAVGEQFLLVILKGKLSLFGSHFRFHGQVVKMSKKRGNSDHGELVNLLIKTKRGASLPFLFQSNSCLTIIAVIRGTPDKVFRFFNIITKPIF